MEQEPPNHSVKSRLAALPERGSASYVPPPNTKQKIILPI